MTEATCAEGGVAMKDEIGALSQQFEFSVRTIHGSASQIVRVWVGNDAFTAHPALKELYEEFATHPVLKELYAQMEADKRATDLASEFPDFAWGFRSLDVILRTGKAIKNLRWSDSGREFIFELER